MGCCCSDSYQQPQYTFTPIQQLPQQYVPHVYEQLPVKPQIFIDQRKLVGHNPNLKQEKLQGYEQKLAVIKYEGCKHFRSNVETEKHQEIRLESLMKEEQYPQEFRCEYLSSYYLTGNVENYTSIKGNFYIFHKYLYFYCPTQVSVKPFGEFMRYVEKKDILYIDKTSTSVFQIESKGGQKFWFRVQKDQESFIEAMNQVALEYNIIHH